MIFINTQTQTYIVGDTAKGIKSVFIENELVPLIWVHFKAINVPYVEFLYNLNTKELLNNCNTNT